MIACLLLETIGDFSHIAGQDGILKVEVQDIDRSSHGLPPRLCPLWLILPMTIATVVYSNHRACLFSISEAWNQIFMGDT